MNFLLSLVQGPNLDLNGPEVHSYKTTIFVCDHCQFGLVFTRWHCNVYIDAADVDTFKLTVDVIE